MSLLFGTISRPSTADLGADSWISSLRESRAKETPSLGSDFLRMTRATSGRTLLESFGKWSPDSSFWRTSLESLFPTALLEEVPLSLGYSESFPRSGSMRSGTASARRRSARLTVGSGSSSWPTANANKAMGLGNQSELWATPRSDKTTSEDPEVWQKRKDAGDVSTPPLTMQAEAWPTPRAGELTGRGAAGRRTGTGGRMLDEEAKKWATPRGMDGEKGGPNQRDGSGSLHLTSQSDRFSRQAPATERDGGGCSSDGPDSRPRLNPEFVTWLMGLPPEWTSFGHLETGSSRLPQQSPSSASMQTWRARMTARLWELA